MIPPEERGGERGRARRLSAPVLTVLSGLLLAACAPTLSALAADHPASLSRAQFEMTRDTFAFPNLVRAHNPGRNDLFANYCIIMARAASQFFRFARFAPAEPPGSPDEYTRLTREVITTTPWAPPRPADQRVVIPAYADLRAFSRAQEAAIKAAFGSRFLSMAQWRTWRVTFALSSEHQHGVARELMRELDAGRPAPLMITNFPHEDLLNHVVLAYDYRTRSDVLEFLAYDPNDADTPMSLHFDLATRSFWVAPLPYGPPGRIRAFRLYTSLLF